MTLQYDKLLGIPVGQVRIDSIGSKADRRGRAARARHHYALPAGSPRPGGKHVLFVAGHGVADVLGGPKRLVDVYRTRQGLPAGAELFEPAQKRPVRDAEAASWRAAHPTQWMGLGAGEDAFVEDMVRQDRGDLESLRWLDSPMLLSQDEAAAAGILHLRTEHLVAGIRQEPGADRWLYYTGLGSHMIGHGSAATREQALVMARAYLYSAWLAEVERIRDARSGDLSWGWPLWAPIDPGDGADPQRDQSVGYLTAAELAARLGVTDGRIRQVAARIPGAIKRANVWLFPAQSVLPHE